MMNEFDVEFSDFWNKIFSGKKNLTDEEADDMLNVVRKFRIEGRLSDG